MKNIWNDPRSLFNGNHFSSIIGFVGIYTRKIVPITGRARSFLVFLEFKKKRKREWGTEQNKINLPKVIIFSTDYNYTT